MTVKYQVFISSTYVDLIEERKEVIQALLELDCFPSGMELFPASNDTQWDLIKDVIDQCDYYLVIIGGRYGSTDSTGFSYTEKEYRYALDKNKPVMAFLHQKPDDITIKKSETDPEKAQKLLDFRALAQTKMCRYWNNPKELGSVVSRSLVQLRQRSPGVGWVRADTTETKSSAEILRLRERIAELENELVDATQRPPPGTEDLARGDDEVTLAFEVKS